MGGVLPAHGSTSSPRATWCPTLSLFVTEGGGIYVADVDQHGREVDDRVSEGGALEVPGLSDGAGIDHHHAAELLSHGEVGVAVDEEVGVDTGQAAKALAVGVDVLEVFVEGTGVGHEDLAAGQLQL